MGEGDSCHSRASTSSSSEARLSQPDSWTLRAFSAPTCPVLSAAEHSRSPPRPSAPVPRRHESSFNHEPTVERLGAPDALDVLRTIMNDPEAKNSDRINAAKAFALAGTEVGSKPVSC
jgi:hypothetical protein